MRKWSLMASVILGLASLVSANTYDLNADFTLASNPNGVWSYGHVQGSTFTAYDDPTPNIAGMSGMDAWVDVKPDIWCPIDYYGNVLKNKNATDVVVPEWPHGMKWYAGKTHMMTPVAGFASGEATMTRFTTPTSGQYDISVDFLKASLNPDVAIDVQVLVNGTSVLLQQISNADVDASYDALNVSLLAGQTVDILVIPVANSGTNDGGFIITQVDATITSVPEPVTLTLLAIGGVAMLRKRM